VADTSVGGDATTQPTRNRRRRDDELLEAAARVFAERGYSDASVQDVADELGILKGSLYHYIKTKEDLLFWLLEGVHNDVERIREEVAAIEGLDPLERIAEWVRRQLLYNMDNLDRISIYYHDMERLSPARLEILTQKRKADSRFVTNLIRDAQAQGLADPGLDARIVNNFLFGTMNWIYRWYNPKGQISRSKIADTCAEYVTSGLIGRR
jgi:TetR/AcrR family transcriptional regulator, cholesterol catabolism regulator